MSEFAFGQSRGHGCDMIMEGGSGFGSGKGLCESSFSRGWGYGQWEENPQVFWKNEYAKPMENALEEILNGKSKSNT